MLDGSYKSMWQYGYLKTKEVGFGGILAGWSLSIVKDSLGYGIFFATSEYVETQNYYRLVTRYYGSLQWWILPEENWVRI